VAELWEQITVADPHEHAAADAADRLLQATNHFLTREVQRQRQESSAAFRELLQCWQRGDLNDRQSLCCSWFSRWASSHSTFPATRETPQDAAANRSRVPDITLNPDKS
jgi:hypothetical protein